MMVPCQPRATSHIRNATSDPQKQAPGPRGPLTPYRGSISGRTRVSGADFASWTAPRSSPSIVDPVRAGAPPPVAAPATVADVQIPESPASVPRLQRRPARDRPVPIRGSGTASLRTTPRDARPTYDPGAAD